MNDKESIEKIHQICFDLLIRLQNLEKQLDGIQERKEITMDQLYDLKNDLYETEGRYYKAKEHSEKTLKKVLMVEKKMKKLDRQIAQALHCGEGFALEYISSKEVKKDGDGKTQVRKG